MGNQEHRWQFFRAGGVDQVAIRDGEDVANLKSLDPKLWVALGMPTQGLSLGEKTLKLLDTDGDKRVRCPEVLAAIGWLETRLGSLDLLLTPGDALSLASIQDESLRGQAQRVLEDLVEDLSSEGTMPPVPSANPTIALAQVVEVLRRYAERPFNGDGVIVAEAMPDDETRSALEDIIKTMGGDPDRSGKPGLGQTKLEAFFEQTKVYLEWLARPEQDPQLQPLGEETAAAATAVREVREKVEDFFLRCRLVGFDEQIAAAVLPVQTELGGLAGKALSAATPELRGLPLARPLAGRALPLRGAVNPAWALELERLANRAAIPLLGVDQELAEPGWASLQEKLAPYEEWQAARPDTPVAALGSERLRQLSSGNLRERLDRLIKNDLALSSEMDKLADLEKLLLFRRDFATVLHNFVSFSRFYGRSEEGAVFQAGTLFIDGRACQLCLEVVDAAKHSLLATTASTYLLYCDCSRAEGQKKTIVAAVTAGDSDRLMVGRNGVFYDRQGKDWDATVTKIVSHPISVGQAFWAPYKRVARLVEEQVAKRASAAEVDAQGRIAAAAEVAISPGKPAKPPGAPKIDIGTVAAIGVAVGGIGAMVTGLLSAFFGLGVWMPLGFLALMLMISGPSMLLAYLKLRQRNLGPILDANGWAINGRARINMPFGAALTDQAKLPPGSERLLRDPFAEKRRPWKLYFALLVLIAVAASWAAGWLDAYLPDRAKSSQVLHRSPPSPAPSTK